MRSARHPGTATGGSLARQIDEDDALLKALARKGAERQRRRTQEIVKKMADASTPEGRIAAARARARAAYTRIDEINAKGELEAVRSAPQVPVDVQAVRIDDLESLFLHRDDLADIAPQLTTRIEKIHAKINWLTRDGRPGFFNKAVHTNHIPVDKNLTILAHLNAVEDGLGDSLDRLIDAIIECGLFPKIKKGKQYFRRCQDGEHCDYCNYLNITDGLMTLLAAYDRGAFYRGGNHFAITVAACVDPAQAKAVGRSIVPEDWDYDNPDSVVYRTGHHARVFQYPDVNKFERSEDCMVEEEIRRFLGAVQTTFGKLAKNGWLDGIRAKVENSIEFLPFASHQHWHAVGSSMSEHDPQKMAEFIQEEVNAILAQTCRGLHADVMVAVIPTPEDLTRWIKYMNKVVKLVEAVASVYNRHTGLRRGDPIFEQFMEELRCYMERSRRVYGMVRRHRQKVRGTHTYMLRRRFVRGNHRFGKGSILSEPERHRAWRDRHAEVVAERRRRAEARKKQQEASGPQGGGERAKPVSRAARKCQRKALKRFSSAGRRGGGAQVPSVEEDDPGGMKARCGGDGPAGKSIDQERHRRSPQPP
jgi:hypothetical protein